MKKFVVGGLLVWMLAAPAIGAKADDVRTSGRVFQLDGVTPLAGAAVAIFDDKGRAIAHGKSDAEGRYMLNVPRGAFHLPEANKTAQSAAGGGSDEAKMAKAESQIKSILRLTGKKVDSRIVGRVIHEGPDSLLNGVVGFDAGAALVDMPPAPTSPGALGIRVTLRGFADLSSFTQVQYLREDATSENGKERKSSSATLDPVLLSKSDEGKPSRIDRKMLKLSEGSALPPVVEIGQKLSLKTRLTVPDELKSEVVVIARNSKSGEIYELKAGENGLYSAEIEVDKTFQKDEQTLSILAYYCEKGAPGRSKRMEDGINSAGLWKLDKNYEYNPLLAASRNRLDLRLTVVDSAKP